MPASVWDLCEFRPAPAEIATFPAKTPPPRLPPEASRSSPPEMVTSPVKVFAADRERVPVPSLVRLVPVPAMPDEKPTLMPLVSIRIGWFPVARNRPEKSVVIPLYCRVPPPKEMAPPVPNATPEAARTVPALIAAPPVNELFPERVRRLVALVSFTKDPAPEMPPDSTWSAEEL